MKQTEKYQGEKEIKMRKTIIISICVLMIILFAFVIALTSINTKNEQKQQAIVTGKFNSVKDILEYYNCEFKGQKNSIKEGFEVDIYTIFKYDLYEDDKSNEKFYNSVIDKIAEFLNYSNFRILDENKEETIEIEVICKNGQISTIYINGIEDYFIYMDSQISLSKYTEISISDVLIQAPELISCVQNNWSGDTNFGSRETIFQNYYIYFDEGIEVRKINGKVYNVIFSQKYENPVVNGFTVGTKRDIIISKMGTPTFSNSDGTIIGYKSRDIYVFFADDQISIYRNTAESGFDKFFRLVDEFLEDKYSLLEFMNELTYLWPDYEKYVYDEETVFLSYPNKGIDIKINYDNTDGIVLYNNIGVSQDTANKYLEHTEFVARLQVDNVYNAELRRIESKKSLVQKCEEYKNEFESEDTRNRGTTYNYYMKMDDRNNIISVYFISQNGQFPNCELSENVDTYVWLNDYCFVYSKAGKGIYYYDLKNQAKGTLMTGDKPFKILSCEDGILKYDEEAIRIQY